MKKIVAVILSLAIIGTLAGCDSSDYKKAVSLYESGNYLEAMERFEALGDYENSRDLLNQCRYDYAKMLFENGDYVNAREQFLIAGQSEEVSEYLRLTAWGMLQTYVEENGPIIDKVETFDPAGSEEIVATYNISNRRGALTIQAQMTSNKKQTDGFFYIRVGKSADTEIVFNMETDSVNVNSDYNYEMENNVNSGPSSKKHYVGSAIWNIHDFYADGDVNDFVEVVEGEFNLGFLYNQQIGVVEFLMVQLPKTDLGSNIRDLGFVSY